MSHYKKPIQELQYVRGLLQGELGKLLVMPEFGRTPLEIKEITDLEKALDHIGTARATLFNIKREEDGK